MSMKRMYVCDICNREIIDTSKLFGLNFTGNSSFTVGAYGCTEGTHICYGCAIQLRNHLAEIDFDEGNK